MNMKIHKPYNKPIIALILASILLSSVVVGIAAGFIPNQSTVSNADYVTLEGVAANDYYDSRQYSYDINHWAIDNAVTGYNTTVQAQNYSYPALNPANNWFTAGKSLRWGMTEFGEFATPAHTGIAYGASATEWGQTESWASTSINANLYIQGWVFYMNYTRAGTMRAIEGYALYSDLQAVEAGRDVVSWDGTKNAGETGWTPSTGSLITSGIEMLYDSARLAVARTSVIVHDGKYNEDVVKITFTVILNKDTKYAIVYKDLKVLIDPKVLDIINDFAFSERYEIDLARNINPSNQAYIHWFKDYNTTTYMHPLTGDEEYDVVQAFNPNRDYIFFAAYWPNTTECAVYNPLVPDLPAGHTRVLPQDTEVLDIPAPINEPNTPWVIAQWRYQHNPILPNYYPNLLSFLAKDSQREIRFVEVAGMTDYNDGQPAPFRALDINASDAVNSVDVEVRFLLDNIFNPEDLYDTVDEPFQWVGLGQSAATTDSAGGAVMDDFAQWAQQEPLGLFDRNDTAFPWTAPVIGMKGTIPFGLDNDANFAPNYLETFSNTGKATGNDGTSYSRTGLNGFVFNYYDAATSARSPPQPIAGGMSLLPGYWYPSMDPLSERWATTAGTSFTPAPYIDPMWDTNGIITLGGMKANGLTRYFNDFYFAISREGPDNYALINDGMTVGMAPTSDGSLATLDYFPISTWASSKATFGYTAGYAVISVARDINGTRGLAVYGWDGRDTYWASAWASQFVGTFDEWIPSGTVALVLHIDYSSADREPTGFTVVKALGTITEFGDNAFVTNYGFDVAAGAVSWSSSLVPLGPHTLPTYEGYYNEWWYAKLPTTSTAKVDFDP